MAIQAAALAKKIKDAFDTYNNGKYKNERDNPQHKKILGDTMKDYFESEMEITYTWAAVLPPPASTPDPVVMFNSKVNFPNFDLTPAHNPLELALYIQAAFVGAVINHASGFTVSPGSFLAPLPPVLGTVTSSDLADSVILTCIATPVCAWALTLINPAPLSGAHAAYTGATTGMVIA